MPYSYTILQDLGRLRITFVPHVLTNQDQPIKIIAIYTIVVLCFPKATNDDIDQNSSRKGVHRILGILACVWIFTGLLVGINIAANGMYGFYGPTGFCKPHISL
jgi:hypothetical protein